MASSIQTKEWRNAQEWYKGGKHNECEIYQRKNIEEITGLSCPKTDERINTYTFEMRSYSNPMKTADGFEWTENFDGKIVRDDTVFLVNFKMVCGSGGAQTRSLREVYHFVNAQLNHLLRNPDVRNIYFINVLEGDQSHKHIDKYTYLLEKFPEDRRQYVFVGDLSQFVSWWSLSSTCSVIK